MAEELLMDADAIDHTGEVLDELLQHTSAQALRMSHLDESLGEIRQAVADVRGAVSQLGAVVQNLPVPQPAQTGTHAIELDHTTKALKGRVALLMGFSVLQTLALGALLLFAFKPMPAQAPPVFVEAPKPAAPVPTPPPPAEVQNSENLLKPPPPATEAPAPAAKPVKKKRK